MRRTFLFGLGILLLSCGYTYGGVTKGRLDRDSRLKYKSDRVDRYGRVYYKRHSVVRGKRGRKYARRFSLRENLTGDKLAVYDTHGYTPHRLGFNVGGRRTERWKYYSIGVEYVFDDEGRLIETSYFPPEGNHID
jgi:hypothetical protein